MKKRRDELIAKHGTVGKNSEMANVDENGTIVKKRKPFLDLVLETHLEQPQDLPLEGVLEEVNTFMAAGYDTTASCNDNFELIFLLFRDIIHTYRV